jgi:para-aminobenzoate synthetase/4-amino-4-deoxychorismate lyase
VTGSSSPLAIVDFSDCDDNVVHRRRFEAPVAMWRATTLAQVVPVLDVAERAARAGQWVVGFVAYEAGPAFDSAFLSAPSHSLPLAWFAAFDTCTEPTNPSDGRGSLFAQDACALVISSRVDVTDHARAVGRIHELIDAGDVYQVNLTVPFTAPLPEPPLALYERMRRAQGGRYSCYLDIGEVQILSASPELFFERRGRLVRSRPMKGTASRGLHPLADAAARDALLRSEKDRAENIMIVDVVRNDLGRVAEVGSVHVAALCEAERYPSVWQLTSTVEAAVDPSRSLADLFGALFPPASITGAPKIRATSIIRDLEGEPRGVYCGAVGIVRPGGDAMFNVAIRTAWAASGSETLHLNAGGGITADSTARGELGEVAAKLDAFTRYVPLAGLFETIRVENGRCVRLDRHLMRLAASAAYFDVQLDRESALRTLNEAIAAAPAANGVARARLELAPNGALSAKVAAHRDHLAEEPLPVRIATSPVDAADVRLYHTTTDRRLYEAARGAAPGMFDVVLWNAAGLATELTRGNLIAELNGSRFTPPIDCGLLGGTLRAELLERGEIREAALSLDDLGRADRLWFVNSLRGWVPIRVVSPEGASAAP